MKILLSGRCIYSLLSAVLLFCNTAFGFQSIQYLGIEQGLSNNAITSIYKDHHGFVWIGTYDGLNKYDGSKITTFRNVWGNAASLSDNHINRIIGVANKIFIGSMKGLVYFDYDNSRFHPVCYSTNKNSGVKKITNNVTALQTDANQNLFIGTDYEGLFIYHKGDKVGRQVAFGNSSKGYSVQSISIGAENTVWLFIRNTGLCRYNQKQNRIEVVNTDLKYANCILADTKRHIWIGTDNGLFSFSSATKTVSASAAINSKLNNDNIIDIKFSKKAELWIGTNGGGVNIVDTLHSSIRYLVSGKINNDHLHSDAVSMIYEDNENRMWIATLRGGVNYLDSKPNPFKLITHDPFNNNSLVNNFVLSFCEDNAQNLWIGTDGGGLSYWDRKANTFTNYVHSAKPSSLRSNFVVSVVEDHDKQVWLALFGGGIDRFDAKANRFVHYDCFNTFTKIQDRSLWKLLVDSHNTLWVGATRGGALYRYNKQADKFELFDEQLTNIHAIYEDKNGTLWGGDYARLIKIDPLGKHHHYINIKNPVRSITEDGYNNLWIGTEGGGLLRYHLPTKSLKRFTQIDGLPGNSLLNVLIDDKDKLWANTFNRLTEYDIGANVFKNYDASDGLQSNQFNFNAALKLRSGELVFGGINGFNIFYPDSIRLPMHQPDLKFTGVYVNNKAVENNTEFTGNQAVVDLKQITLPYNEATLAIDYTAPEYSYPDKLSYAYYLEGWDHGWNDVGKLKTAYYTRLNEGKYTLRVKVTNSSGSWNPRQLTLQITVLPPFYRTWWAYMLYVAFTVSVVYCLWLYRIRQTRLKYEVQIANMNVEREKELNEKKLSFFTNISHEFRTPLTLIINPIKDLLRTENTKNNEELQTIHRNARRLLGLVDHLLLFRKTESENDSLNKVNLNFTKLCNEVYLCFTQQAKIKQIKYHFNFGDCPVYLCADRAKMEIAIFNLISNAIKFTPQGGEINIQLTEQEHKVLLTVEDDGCGIAEGTGERLFDKFYQIKDSTTLKTGFGIGLYLVKSFVKSHGGEITYVKNAEKGTRFIVELPKTSHEEVHLPAETDQPAERLFDELMGEIKNVQPAEEEVTNFELLISDRQSVLIIDDNVDMRDYIIKIFKDRYKIYEAANAELGLELVKKILPDLVISDISMESMSGIDLCTIMKKDSSLSHIPVILITGDPNLEIQLKGIEVGAVDFVSKPFEKDLLLARVQGILKDRRELQRYFYNEVTLKSNSRNISENHKEFLYKCISIIENYLIDPHFDVKTIADEMGMSYSSLFKKIKAISGQSVNNFVRFVRLRKAAEMMINTHCNVNEAALNCGFNDIKYFREQFIKLFGVKPSEFIKQHRQAFNKTYLVEQSFR
ncbi:hypothetical protein A0256_06420 [Mucilaginibacter sp. PAMC 26640]|nr:hypothetical protein A0256_06420 [Mucilaginibacter sp. PAMC 26640]